MQKNKSIKYFRRSSLALACATVLLSSTAMAQSGGLTGRITDASNTVYFEGARVELKELGVSAVSARDGSFRFTQLPEGTYTLVIHYLGAQPSEQKITIQDGQILDGLYQIGSQGRPLENVIVQGQRAGQAGALNRQKNASGLKSIVSADSIGQLPDQNAAEALQRLPGLFIQRDQGEGRFVGIRGIDPNLNNVTINGVNVPSPESGVRSVAMDVIPSELVQSLEVSKTVTPDMDASAIGGSIEVKSLSAFDRQGQSYSFTGQASYNELVEKTSPKLSASFSDIYDLNGGIQLGVASAISWFERDFGSHNIETDGGWGEFEFEDADTGDDIELFAAEEIEQRHYLITRERLGAALNFDLATSATDAYYLRMLYSQFSDDEYRLRNEYKYDKGATLTNEYSAHKAVFVDAEMDRDTKDRYEEQEIFSFVLGGENQFKDWLLEYNLGFSQSSEKEPNRIDADFAGEALTLGYASTNNAPRLSQTADAHDLSNFFLDEIAFENNLTEDEELSIRIDVSKDFVWKNHNIQFKFGAKHSQREKFNDVNVIIYDGGFDDATAANFAANEPDFQLGGFGPGIGRQTLRDFVMNNRGQFDQNILESQISNAGDSYISDEDITAAYAMLTLDIDNWHIVTGLRYEHTAFSTQGNKVELIVDEVSDDEQVNITLWQEDKDYSHLFPSLNIRYSFSDKLVSRFAYTQTLARPTFGEAAAYQIIETEITDDETERKAAVGNPALDPYESSNLDLSIEYYPGHIGVMSAGVFYKDIDNYIVKMEVQDNGEWDGYDEVIQSVNGGSASLTGLELAWSKNFESGLFINANGTFVDADEQLPHQADTVGNLILGYEDSNWSIRVSGTYKSESFQFSDNDADVLEDTHTQVDFSAKYFLSDTIQVYFNATNLTDEPYYLFHGDSRYNYQYEEYGQTFEFGVTLTSL